jgi:hypothetical protein
VVLQRQKPIYYKKRHLHRTKDLVSYTEFDESTIMYDFAVLLQVMVDIEEPLHAKVSVPKHVEAQDCQVVGVRRYTQSFRQSVPSSRQRSGMEFFTDDGKRFRTVYDVAVKIHDRRSFRVPKHPRETVPLRRFQRAIPVDGFMLLPPGLQ